MEGDECLVKIDILDNSPWLDVEPEGCLKKL